MHPIILDCKQCGEASLVTDPTLRHAICPHCGTQGQVTRFTAAFLWGLLGTLAAILLVLLLFPPE